MADPTPGEVAYVAYWRTFRPQFTDVSLPLWTDIDRPHQAAWEAAAQAVQPPPGTWGTLAALDALRHHAAAVVQRWHTIQSLSDLDEAITDLEWCLKMLETEEPPHA